MGEGASHPERQRRKGGGIGASLKKRNEIQKTENHGGGFKSGKRKMTKPDFSKKANTTTR